jgi:hypothetical protein
MENKENRPMKSELSVALLPIFAALLMFGMTGCMSMMIDQGMMEHGSHAKPSTATVQKEVERDSVRAIATFPSAIAGQPSVFSLELMDGSGYRIANAAIVPVVTFQRAEHSQSASHGAHSSRLDSIAAVRYDDSSGKFLFTHIFDQSGMYQVEFHITHINTIALEKHLVVAGDVSVQHQMESGHAGMGSGMSTAGAIGIVIGAAIMVAMMGWRFL